MFRIMTFYRSETKHAAQFAHLRLLELVSSSQPAGPPGKRPPRAPTPAPAHPLQLPDGARLAVLASLQRRLESVRGASAREIRLTVGHGRSVDSGQRWPHVRSMWPCLAKTWPNSATENMELEGHR